MINPHDTYVSIAACTGYVSILGAHPPHQSARSACIDSAANSEQATVLHEVYATLSRPSRLTHACSNGVSQYTIQPEAEPDVAL